MQKLAGLFSRTDRLVCHHPVRLFRLGAILQRSFVVADGVNIQFRRNQFPSLSFFLCSANSIPDIYLPDAMRATSARVPLAACDILTHDETPPRSDRRRKKKQSNIPKIPPPPPFPCLSFPLSKLKTASKFKLSSGNSLARMLHLKPIPSPLLSRPREWKQICAHNFFIRLLLLRPSRKSNRTKRFPIYPPFHCVPPSPHLFPTCPSVQRPYCWSPCSDCRKPFWQ